MPVPTIGSQLVVQLPARILFLEIREGIFKAEVVAMGVARGSTHVHEGTWPPPFALVVQLHWHCCEKGHSLESVHNPHRVMNEDIIEPISEMLFTSAVFRPRLNRCGHTTLNNE